MRNKDLEPLKGLSLPIIAPKELPQDFTVEKIVPLSNPDSGDGYEIDLKSERGELKLRAASVVSKPRLQGGERIEFNTRYFGDCFLERSGEELVSDWFSEMEAGYPAYCVVARGIDPDQVIEFVQSLDYVRVN